MRAVVLDAEPRSLRLAVDWPEPEPGPGEVLVQVRGVGICGSDLALHAGRRQPPSFPWVVGHETFGEIAATGPGVDESRARQRVVVEPNIPCGACPACRSGRTSSCPHRKVLGFSVPGTLAERIVVPAAFAWPVPEDWADGDAVCAEPLTVALAAVRRAMSVQAGTEPSGTGRCLVIGAGSQGTLACIALSACGLAPAVLDPQPGRRALAAELGARQAGPGEGGFDLVFETSGAPEALAEAVDRAARGGLIVLMGLNSQPVPLVTQRIVQRQLTLMGSLIYDHPGDFAAVTAAGNRQAGRVLRACYPMAEAELAFRAATQVAGKTWIRVQGPEG
ncbi:MAG TPA: alcohol dehydrogenase catalytic domain-containing protein [Streptosporangiaceae bacterium]|nr:alcohol dehydrogenase catalytic domain-containing protein [Streptosporangiaceae bacterium]